MKISVLCTDSNHPVINDLREWSSKMAVVGHDVSLVFDKSKLIGGDVLFLVSCSQIIKDVERYKYRATLVLHASDLPKGRGWSPHIWSILGGVNEITVSLLEASDTVDSGEIWLKTTFSLEGHELLDEINLKLFAAQLFLMTEAINHFGEIKPSLQEGNPSEYMRKRTAEDSRLDLNKTIAEQFNLLRLVDSQRFPAFFEHQGIKYLIRIEKVKK